MSTCRRALRWFAGGSAIGAVLDAESRVASRGAETVEAIWRLNRISGRIGLTTGRYAMTEIGAFEVKNRLGELLHRVEQGQEILIMRGGKPVARLVPVTPDFNRARARQAVANIIDRSKGVTLGGLGLKALVDEGRR